MRLIYQPDSPNYRFDEKGQVVLPGEVFKVEDERGKQLLARHPDVLKEAAVPREKPETPAAASSSSAQPMSGTASSATAKEPDPT